jgi:hypothetical protein
MKHLIFGFSFLLAGCASYTSMSQEQIQQQVRQEYAETQAKIDSGAITFSSTSGLTKQDAIIINGATDETHGICAEYLYLAKLFGERDKDWQLVQQALVRDRENGKAYDEMEVKLLPASQQKTIYFDITNFLGRR